MFWCCILHDRNVKTKTGEICSNNFNPMYSNMNIERPIRSSEVLTGYSTISIWVYPVLLVCTLIFNWFVTVAQLHIYFVSVIVTRPWRHIYTQLRYMSRISISYSVGNYMSSIWPYVFYMSSICLPLVFYVSSICAPNILMFGILSN